MVVGGGFEPPKLSRQIYSLIPLATREPHHQGAGILLIKHLLVNFEKSRKYSKTEEKWSWREESNPRPADYKSAALPTELRQLHYHASSERRILVDVVSRRNRITEIFPSFQTLMAFLDFIP